MHSLNPAAVTPEMGRKIRAHAPDVINRTPLSILARDLGKPSSTYWLLVPCDATPGDWHEVRVVVRTLPDGSRVIDAAHHGSSCRASIGGKRCWHLFCGALWVARNARDPDTGEPLFPDRRIPEPPVARLQPRPAEPAQTPRPREATSGFYD